MSRRSCQARMYVSIDGLRLVGSLSLQRPHGMPSARRAHVHHNSVYISSPSTTQARPTSRMAALLGAEAPSARDGAVPTFPDSLGWVYPRPRVPLAGGRRSSPKPTPTRADGALEARAVTVAGRHGGGGGKHREEIKD
ncbi:unnamed protein product [Diplocarpon coronariae]